MTKSKKRTQPKDPGLSEAHSAHHTRGTQDQGSARSDQAAVEGGEILASPPSAATAKGHDVADKTSPSAICREWKISLTPPAQRMLREIKDRRIQATIFDTIERLKVEPEKQGKPLMDDMLGYRSIRSVGQRYRVLYTIAENRVIVFVVAIGIRREGSKGDIYALARKLLRRGLLSPTEEPEEP